MFIVEFLKSACGPKPNSGFSPIAEIFRRCSAIEGPSVNASMAARRSLSGAMPSSLSFLSSMPVAQKSPMILSMPVASGSDAMCSASCWRTPSERLFRTRKAPQPDSSAGIALAASHLPLTYAERSLHAFCAGSRSVAAKRIGCCSLLSSRVQAAAGGAFFSSAAGLQPEITSSAAAAAETAMGERQVSDMIGFLEGEGASWPQDSASLQGPCRRGRRIRPAVRRTAYPTVGLTFIAEKVEFPDHPRLPAVFLRDRDAQVFRFDRRGEVETRMRLTDRARHRHRPRLPVIGRLDAVCERPAHVLAARARLAAGVDVDAGDPAARG